MSVTSIAKLCRMCIKESYSFSYIYCKYINYDSQLFEVMNDVCHLDIQLNDGLPEFICNDCHDKIGEFLEFRMRSHECKAIFVRLKKNLLEENDQNKEGHEIFSGSMKELTDGFGDQVNIKNEDVGADMFSTKLEPVEAVYSEDSNRVCDEIATSPMELDFEESEIVEVPEPQITTNPSELDFEESEIVEVPEPQEEARSEQMNDLALSADSILHSSTKGNEVVLKGNGEKVRRISSLRAGEGGKKLNKDGSGKGGMVTSAGKPYASDKCRKSFGQKERLRRHMILHIGEERITCEVCQKKFKSRYYLKIHMMLHSGEKPFECEICRKSFIQKGQLKIHMSVHDSSKQFDCEICLQSFSLKEQLKNHMWVHVSGKPFPCNQCVKRFTDQRSLSHHMRVHDGYKPFGCVECGKTFTLKQYLNNHMSVHSDSRPFMCNVCGNAYKKKNGLIYHKNLHHK